MKEWDKQGQRHTETFFLTNQEYQTVPYRRQPQLPQFWAEKVKKNTKVSKKVVLKKGWSLNRDSTVYMQ